MSICAYPGCDQFGSKLCALCLVECYCCDTCQKGAWTRHREVCIGHLRKKREYISSFLQRARGFKQANNHVEALRCAEMALTKLKKMKNRPLAIIELIDEASNLKGSALRALERRIDYLECVTENYALWANSFRRDLGHIDASFELICSLTHNKDYEQAHLIAGTVYEMTLYPTNNDIPEDQQQRYLAEASSYYARATYWLALAGGIPPEEKQKVGEETIAVARKALEIQSQLNGVDSCLSVIHALADVLEYFNNDDGDEVPRLREQALAIDRRVNGISARVAFYEKELGDTYYSRAKRADNQDRRLLNLELALPHFHEAAQIYKAFSDVARANYVAHSAAEVEVNIRQIRG